MARNKFDTDSPTGTLITQTLANHFSPTGKFYGTQGSFPSYNPQLGGQTTCHTLKFADTLVIFDTGSGIIELGNELIVDHLMPGVTWIESEEFMTQFLKKDGRPEDLGKALIQAGLFKAERKPLRIVIIYSHVHGDHLFGIQSFKPIYSPNTEIEFFGGLHTRPVKDKATGKWGTELWDIERTMKERVFTGPAYPVEEEWLASKRTYNTVKENDTFHIGCSIGGDIKVEVLPMYHPNQAYAYRFTWGGKVIVVTLDHEHGHEYDKNITKAWEGADVVVTEVQYDEKMYATKKTFGHTTPNAAAKHATEAKPLKIITTHHDPDASLETVIEIARTLEEKSGIRTHYATRNMRF